MLTISSSSVFLFNCLVGCLVVYYVLFIYRNWRLLKFARNHNGFFWPILPVVGTLYLAVPMCFFQRLPVNPMTCLRWIKKYSGYPFGVWCGGHFLYVTSDPKEINVVLHHPDCFNKGYIYEAASEASFFSTTIFEAPYETWKPKRRLLRNSFRFSVLQQYMPTFYKLSCQIAKSLESLKEFSEIQEELSEYSFINFFLTAAGLEEEKCGPEVKKLGTYIARLQELMQTRVVYPILSNYIWLSYFPSGRQHTKYRGEVQRIILDIFKQKYQQHHNTTSFNSEKAMPLLDLLFSVSNEMDEKEIVDEIGFFAIAATETTGNTMTFCLLLLGMHPEIQEVLYEEVKNEVGQNDILIDDLPKLKYTEAVIQETLRLFPPLPFVQRFVGADVKIGSHVIPRGTNFTIDAFHLQRDEKYWPNPLKFDPSRFLPENASRIKPHTFIPFLDGQRDCLGKQQAMLLMKTTIANLVRKFKVISSQKSIDDIKLISTLTLRPAYSIDCRFSPRMEQ